MNRDYMALVEDLAVPHRRKEVKRSLMLAGSAATPAVRQGLRHPSSAVRSACCQVLDHFLDEAALPELLEKPLPSRPACSRLGRARAGL